MKAELWGEIKIEVVKVKLCDALKIEWLFDYLKSFGHVDGNCPYKPVSIKLIENYITSRL